MGKKIANASNVRKEGKKDLQEVTRKIKINLHKQLHDVQFKKKAPRAIKILKKLAQRNMGTKDVRVDPELNKELWKKGVRNLQTRIEVILERKKKEDEEESEEKMYTLIKLAPTFETV
jgi:large subunit ribosomal protein L31e